jgi:hypothetical protein
MKRQKSKLKTRLDSFVAHGGIGLTNTGGIEVQISERGDQVRVKYSGDDHCSGWVDIEEVGDEDGAYFIDPESGNQYSFHEIHKY